MSTMQVTILPAAQSDLRLQSEWYFEQAGEAISFRYLAAFERAVDLLKAFPDTGRIRKFRDARLKALRSIALEGAFRVHLVFYRIHVGEIVIVRVMHGMRDLPRRLTQEP